MSDAMLADLAAIAPELWLTGTILAALTLDLLLGHKGRAAVGLLSLLGIAGALGSLHATGSDHAVRAFGLLSLDGHADLFRTLIISGTGLVVLHAMVFRGIESETRSEFYPMLLSVGLGGCLLVSTDHLLMLLLAMELLSLPSYLLAGWQRTERRSSEAALKYLVYGAVASAIMVFGFSLLYGLSGSLWMSDVGAAVLGAWEFGDEWSRAGVVASTVFVFVGFGFKIAAFPFHFWAPDVYEGSPTPVTTLLAVVSKAAAFGLLVRFVDGVFLGDAIVSGDWLARFSWVIAVLSAVTMTYGNITAVLQRNAKRLLAYSSIAHAGYLLMGVAVMTADPGGEFHALGMDALLFYMVTYYLATLGAFACVMSLANRFGAEDTDDYRGLGWSAPWIGGALAVFLLSLTGLPPTVGFVGKLYLLRATLESGLGWLAVVAALNSVVALFYYFKLARALFLRGDTEVVPGIPSRGLIPVLAHASLAALVVATIWFGILWDDLAAWVSASLL